MKSYKKAVEKARRIDELYDRGELTQDEKRQRKIEVWQRAYDEVSKVMMQELRDDNPLFIITDSGARGSTKQLAQLVGMRGLMMGGFDFRSGGERLVEELPVQHNFQEGLTTLEYFVSGYGARRGLASTALLDRQRGLPHPAHVRCGAGCGHPRTRLQNPRRHRRQPHRARGRPHRTAVPAHPRAHGATRPTPPHHGRTPRR
jgi:hypothetical protein